MIVVIVSVFALAVVIGLIGLLFLDGKNKKVEHDESIELNNNKPHIHHSIIPAERWQQEKKGVDEVTPTC